MNPQSSIHFAFPYTSHPNNQPSNHSQKRSICSQKKRQYAQGKIINCIGHYQAARVKPKKRDR
jgi:hypothetical protein